MTKEERQAKIEWLMRYRIAEIRIDRMKAEQDRWRDRATSITQRPTYFQYRGKSDQEKMTKEERRRNAMAPVIIRGGRGLSMEDIVAEIEALDHDIQDMVDRALQLRRDIGQAIKALADDREQLVLYYKYCEGLYLEEICVKMGYSYRHIKRMHERALINLNMSPNVP